MTVFSIARQGSQEIAFDNEPQPVPWKLTLTLSNQGGKENFQIRFQTAGVNVWQAFQQVKFARLMAKGGILRIKNMQTNISDETKIQPGEHTEFQENWFTLLNSLCYMQDKLKIPIQYSVN